MTDVNEERERKNRYHKTIWHSGAEEQFDQDDKFRRKYDDANEEVIYEHVASGDQFRIRGDSMGLPILAAAPTSPSAGDLAIQDGVNWNPTASGAVELVVYNGTSWVSA